MKAAIKKSSFSGNVTAPSSKSVGHRAIICAALSDKPVTVYNCAKSDDIDATINSVKALGASVKCCGSTIHITPVKRNIKNATIDCYESGSTARFIIPVAAALGVDNVTFTGRGRLPERPLKPLIDVLCQNGITCSSDKLPLTLCGKLKSGTFKVPGNISSQYISGLLMALSIVEGKSEIVLTSRLESAGYVDITINELMLSGADITITPTGYEIIGKPTLFSKDRTVEGDWSQAAFFLAAGVLSDQLTISGLNMNSLQGDRHIVSLLKRFGANITTTSSSVTVKKSELCGIEIDASQIPDLVPILSVIASFAKGKTVIKNAQRLRIKESDRIKETATRLKAFGIKCEETDNGLIVYGSTATAADIDSANDHRIVMSFSILASTCNESSSINDAEAINKSYPLFFEDFKSIGGDVVCHQ